MLMTGNKAFMITVSAGAVLSVLYAAVFGFSTLALAVVFLSVLVTVPLGLFFEKKIDERKERQLEQTSEDE